MFTISKKVNVQYLSFLLFCLPFLAQSQPVRDLDSLIKETNHYLSAYKTLSPFGPEYYSINDFNLTKAERESLITGADNDLVLSDNKDSIDRYHIINYFQEKIIENLNLITEHPHFQIKNIQSSLETGDLQIVISSDQKLINFILDEKTGGTYQSRISIFYYSDYENFDVEEDKFYEVLVRDGYSSIDTIMVGTEVNYVLKGFVRGCSYCFDTYIQLVHIENGVFKNKFKYDVVSRNWEDTIEYDSFKKSITAVHHLNDFAPECNCKDGKKFEQRFNESDEFEYKCKCVFKFNGNNFDLMESSLEKVTTN